MIPVFDFVGTDPCVCPDSPKAGAKLPMQFARAGRTWESAPTVGLDLVVTEVQL